MARILLVDDDEAFREVLRVMIESLGHAVVVAVNGREAMAKLDQGAIDLVITDLLMPEKDGFETIRYLRRRAPTVRMIAMSGGGRVGPALYLDVAEQLGAEYTLVKPFSKSDLEMAIANTLSDPPFLVE
jgi:CheY-like chemotaxis protein